MFARLFRKNGETRTERILDDLKIPKVVEISSTVAIVYHRYERLAVLKMFLRLIFDMDTG